MKGKIMNINNNVQMHKIMFSSNLTLEDMGNQLQINLRLLCKMVLRYFKVMKVLFALKRIMKFTWIITDGITPIRLQDIVKNFSGKIPKQLKKRLNKVNIFLNI